MARVDVEFCPYFQDAVELIGRRWCGAIGGSTRHFLISGNGCALRPWPGSYPLAGAELSGEVGRNGV